MNTMFGAPMDDIMYVVLATFLAVTATVVVLALRNHLLLKLGVRNIPRRRIQTTLIVAGLMLSTVTITSAFATGDTMSYSIRALSVDSLGATDEIVTTNAGTGSSLTGSAGGSNSYFSVSTATHLQSHLAESHYVDGALGVIVQIAPLTDLTSRQTKANAALIGIPTTYPSAFGALMTIDGKQVMLSRLGANEVFLNQEAAHALNARRGDKLRFFVGDRPQLAVVGEVLRDENLAAGGLASNGTRTDPVLLLSLARLQQITGHPGQITSVLVSNRGNALEGARYSIEVTDEVRALLANQRQVIAIQHVLSTAKGTAALAALQQATTIPAATLRKLQDLRAQVVSVGQSSKLKSLLSDPAVIGALSMIKVPTITATLDVNLTSISDYTIQPVKQEGLDTADRLGNFFSEIFMLLGLFSISSGILLIFLIFVMLAAARRTEMGMARALGTKRRQLIEEFLFEGYVYDLGAAVLGAVLGIAVGLGIMTFMSGLLGAGGLPLQQHIESRSVVVAFCLGTLVTFFTVIISSWRISRLNIVAALHDLPEERPLRGGVAGVFRLPHADLSRADQRLGRRGAAMQALSPPIGQMIIALRILIVRGPLLLLPALPLVVLGMADRQSFPFGLGISLALLGTALLIRWFAGLLHVPPAQCDRIGFSLAGILLVAYWIQPSSVLESIGVPKLQIGIEMWFLAGMMLVLGAVWAVVYNLDQFLGVVVAVIGPIGRLAPMLKMAVIYPMQYKLRTGLTLAMFSLVLFTLVVMSVILNSVFGHLDLNRDAGGYEAFGTTSVTNSIPNVAARIKADPFLNLHILAVGGIGRIPVGLRQPGQRNQSWQDYQANIVDDAYLGTTRFNLHARAAGYNSDQQVWDTLRTHTGYAVVDSSLVRSKNFAGFGSGGMSIPGFSSGGSAFQIEGFFAEDRQFAPIRIQLRDTRTGIVVPVTVIGVLDRLASYLYPLTAGVYTGWNTLAAVHDSAAPPNVYVFRIAPRQDVHQTALALGATFLSNGLDMQETQVVYDDAQSVSIGIYSLLDGYMGLGLVVGIAALGLIAARSVVERRPQIGILRAIGFRRGMVRTIFLLESSLMAILGSLIGVALGIVLARNVLESISNVYPSIKLTLSWPQIGLIVLIAYAASLLTTYLPAWQASRIYPAQALRYE